MDFRFNFDTLHQFIIDKNDPLYDKIIGDRGLVPVLVPDTEHVAGWHLDLTGLQENTPEYEYYEGFMVVDFVPTSEHLSSWMAELVEVKMRKLGVTVESIEWWETPKSRSVFYRDGV